MNDNEFTEDVIWQAETYSIHKVEIEINGEKREIRAWAGKWNGYYRYTGESPERTEERLAVWKALAAEIEKLKSVGQKPDYTDREV